MVAATPVKAGQAVVRGQTLVVIEAMKTEHSLPALKLGELDLALAQEYAFAPNPKDPALERTELLEDQVRLALPAAHALAGRPEVDVAALETDPWIAGKEGSFLICSFWLVSALAIVGEDQRARDLMERLLRVASPLGLYAEEFDVDTGRHLGNFPQAFSHLALIEAAARIIVAEFQDEVS